MGIKNRVRALRLFVGTCVPVFKGGYCCGLGKPPSLNSCPVKAYLGTCPTGQGPLDCKKKRLKQTLLKWVLVILGFTGSHK